MKCVAEYVSKLTHEQRHEIVRSYEQFCKDGFTGATAVRVYTRDLMDYLDMSSLSGVSIVEWMKKLAQECYRYYYAQMFPDNVADI